MWELNYKERWAPENWCFWTVVLEKTLESPLDCKEIQPVHPRGDQSWVFTGGCWSWNSNTLATWCKELTPWKRPWCWKRLKAGEGDNRGWDGWMASLTQWTWVWASLGVGDGQGGLECCSPWGCKESDTTNWATELNQTVFIPRVLSLPFPSVPSMALLTWTQRLLSLPLPTVHELPSKPFRLYLHRNSSHHTTCTRDLVVKFYLQKCKWL